MSEGVGEGEERGLPAQVDIRVQCFAVGAVFVHDSEGLGRRRVIGQQHALSKRQQCQSAAEEVRRQRTYRHSPGGESLSSLPTDEDTVQSLQNLFHSFLQHQVLLVRLEEQSLEHLVLALHLRQLVLHALLELLPHQLLLLQFLKNTVRLLHQFFGEELCQWFREEGGIHRQIVHFPRREQRTAARGRQRGRGNRIGRT